MQGAPVEPFPGGVVIHARDLGHKRVLGTPFEHVDLDVAQGAVTAVCGMNGSGKTALLLTLAGRMRFTHGTLVVMGHQLPREARAVQKRVALALFPGVNDLDRAQRVRDAVSAEFHLFERRPNGAAIALYLRQWGLGSFENAKVADLAARELTLLGIALAWVRHPDIIAVDDIESGLTQAQSRELMELLRGFAHERNATLIVGVNEPTLAACADRTYHLSERN
ncbi:ATP-binding cassette domain-containing protein [Eggerthellaceae bacterium zg-1084]|uniref:ATP-binding cassette domain-containing protein n=1 Tax=Berryella wangjianweii TaxID=2734634 RepID=UPI0015580272|nr:ATP-binding cassette domain-containing protein [Berryella wangjianweii]NPD31096.1 ATP-binding cassette domain-containing protein [Berryella wangjianweii]